MFYSFCFAKQTPYIFFPSSLHDVASTCTPATCYCVPRNYSFEEVDIFFNTLRVNVRSETTSTVQLGRSRNTNKSSREGSFPADISISVRNVMQSKWFGGEAFPLTRTVQHTGFDESRRSTLFSFRTNWGFNGNTFQSSTIRSPNSERVTLQPGQSSIATLNAQKTILSLTVSYLISSGGFLVVNYDPQFQGRNDWALPASRNIFNRATITVEEQLEIEYYSNPSVTFSRPSGL